MKRAEEQNRSESAIVPANDQFGDLHLIQSAETTDKKWTKFVIIGSVIPSLHEIEKHVGEEVLIRGRAFNVNHKGKCCFIILRQHVDTVQCCIFQSANSPKAMVNYAGKIPKESIIDVYGTVQHVETPIDSATFKHVEISVSKIFVVSRVKVELPFQLDSAMRTDAEIAANDALAEEDRKFITVNADTRLDYRWIDLRTPANQAIIRLSSAVGLLFREYLINRNFVEIHTPKIIPGASEGGSNVFKLDYFGNQACLAQSPQFYKQMSTACADFERVFEVGPVVRAENSNTHRHLCEFTGLDLEMTIKENYHEALDLIADMFVYIFDGLNSRFAKELAAVNVAADGEGDH